LAWLGLAWLGLAATVGVSGQKLRLLGCFLIVIVKVHSMRIAVISDIHGNLPALKAFVRDIKRRGVDAVVNLGDSLSGPLLPLETAQFLIKFVFLNGH